MKVMLLAAMIALLALANACGGDGNSEGVPEEPQGVGASLEMLSAGDYVVDVSSIHGLFVSGNDDSCTGPDGGTECMFHEATDCSLIRGAESILMVQRLSDYDIHTKDFSCVNEVSPSVSGYTLARYKTLGVLAGGDWPAESELYGRRACNDICIVSVRGSAIKHIQAIVPVGLDLGPQGDPNASMFVGYEQNKTLPELEEYLQEAIANREVCGFTPEEEAVITGHDEHWDAVVSCPELVNEPAVSEEDDDDLTDDSW